MPSCIYEGVIAHCRHVPIEHRFRYRVFMVYLDLDELPLLVENRRTFSGNLFAPSSFLRRDHLWNPALPLAEEVRQLVMLRTGRTIDGPVRLLTQLRVFGYYMSPLNLFYIFDSSETRIDSIVAEVNNTPWNERHCYVLWEGNGCGVDTEMQFVHPKSFHVSPFMGMDMEYHWRMSVPGATLQVQLANTQRSRRIFEASLTLERRDLNRETLRRMTARYPLMTLQIYSSIYFQALRLWWKRCPYYPHPKSANKVSTEEPLAGRGPS